MTIQPVPGISLEGPVGQQPSTVLDALTRRGVSRRRFLQFCSAMAAALALPSAYGPRIAQALESSPRPVLLWLEFQDCAGNTESMLRSSHPDVAEVVLETLSWEYHETIMSGAGHQAEAVIERVRREHKGEYIVVVEGAIPTAEGGTYCTIGGTTALQIAREVCSDAALVIAAGACAWDGGFVASGPTGAVGIGQAVPGLNLVNLGGCPMNSANAAAVLVHYLTFGEAPPLDAYRRPLFAYGHLIHDQCERRAHFDAGRYVEAWGDAGHRKGWCLYKMGCKGPEATFNCPSVRWNDGTSWPVGAGHGCIGCASPQFWTQMSPFYGRLPNVKLVGLDLDAQTIGLGAVAAVAAGTAAHAVGMGIKMRRAAAQAEVAGTSPAAQPPADVPPEVPEA